MSFPKFLLLPPELQEQIIESLEEHLNPLSIAHDDKVHYTYLHAKNRRLPMIRLNRAEPCIEPNTFDDRRTEVGRPTLVALSRVSRHLRSLVLPLRYRRIYHTQKRHSGICRQLTLFAVAVRTILEDAYLAAHVKELVIKESLPMAGLWADNPIAKGVLMDLSRLAIKTDFPCDPHLSPIISPLLGLIQHLLISTAPLEKLRLDLLVEPDSREPWGLLAPYIQASKPWSIPSLKVLEITHEACLESPIQAGFSLGSCQDELMLVRACTNLEELTVDTCKEVRDLPRLPHLKRLVVKNSFLSAAHFENLLGASDILEAFTYLSVTATKSYDGLPTLSIGDWITLKETGSSEATPREIGKALARHAQTLKFLDLRIGLLSVGTLTRKDMDRTVCLEEFQRLEVLVLKNDAFIYPTNLHVPEDLRRLDVDNIRISDIRAMLKDVRDGRFPHMTGLELRTFHQTDLDLNPAMKAEWTAALHDLQEACRERNIQVQVDWENLITAPTESME